VFACLGVSLRILHPALEGRQAFFSRDDGEKDERNRARWRQVEVARAGKRAGEKRKQEVAQPQEIQEPAGRRGEPGHERCECGAVAPAGGRWPCARSRASVGYRCQCMPAPLRRASTTSLLALSTMPEPRGQPSRRNCGYCIKGSRLRR